MNFMLVTTHFPPSVGGVETQNFDTVKFLASRGHKVHVIHAGTHPAISVESSPFEGLPSRLKLDHVAYDESTASGQAIGLPRIMSKVKRCLADSTGEWLLDAHERETAIASLLVKNRLRERRIKVIWTLHGPDMFCCNNYELRDGVYSCEGVGSGLSRYGKCLRCLRLDRRSRLRVAEQIGLFNLTSRYCDGFVVKRKKMLEVAARNGYPKERLFYIPYWVDTHMFRPLPKRCPVEPNPVPQDRLTVMHVGRLTPAWKGGELLVRLAEHVCREISDVAFLHVGGFGEDNELRGKILTSVRRSGLEKNFIFIGARPRWEIPHWFSLADIAIFPSYYDNLNWTLVEAISCGLPIVATDVGSIRDVLTHNENAMLAPPDARVLAEEICTLLADIKLRTRLSQNARSYAINKLDSRKILPRLETFYLSSVMR